MNAGEGQVFYNVNRIGTGATGADRVAKSFDDLKVPVTNVLEGVREEGKIAALRRYGLPT